LSINAFFVGVAGDVGSGSGGEGAGRRTCPSRPRALCGAALAARLQLAQVRQRLVVLQDVGGAHRAHALGMEVVQHGQRVQGGQCWRQGIHEPATEATHTAFYAQQGKLTENFDFIIEQC